DFAACHGEYSPRLLARFRPHCRGGHQHDSAGRQSEHDDQVRQGTGRARQAKTRDDPVCLHRDRLNHASCSGAARRCRQRRIFACALSRRGAAPMLTDLLAGQVQVIAADLTVLVAQIEAGTVVPIGAAADQCNQIIPDVPTLAEQGYPKTDASNWYALLAPAKTPPAVIKKLNDAVNAALADPDVRGKIVKSGAVPIGGTPEALATFMRAEYDKWGRLVREHGIREQ